MTLIKVDTITPSEGVLTLGDPGDTIIFPDVKVNTVKDSGSNTMWVSDGNGNLSSVTTGFGGSLKLISTHSVTDSSGLEITTGIDSTYKEYIFKFISINGTAASGKFQFQVSTDGGASWGITQTSTWIYAYHYDGNFTSFSLSYNIHNDENENTDWQILASSQGTSAVVGSCGELHLMNPSSTSYSKNWFSRTSYEPNPTFALPYTSEDGIAAGNFNTTDAIDAIKFKTDYGTFDGKIKMYGVL